MKLSQVLKDWPENKNYDLSWVGAGAIDIAEMRGEMAGHNHALTSCDREIDREALAKELFITFGTDVKEWEHSVQRKLYFDFAEIIILSMPTWLKRIEK